MKVLICENADNCDDNYNGNCTHARPHLEHESCSSEPGYCNVDGSGEDVYCIEYNQIDTDKEQGSEH